MAIAPTTKVIALTGQNDRSNAVRAIGMGAYDFFAKPFEPDILGLVIARAFRVAELEHENRLLRQSQLGEGFTGLITRDPGMLKICRQIERLAPTQATVMLLGDSGTGKEVLARALHNGSSRADKRFVAINCAAIPDALLESELFGYEKGALPARPSRPRARSNSPIRARCFWTRSVICRWPCRPSCCAFCRSGSLSGSAGARKSQWMYG
jgi:two-component system NtrC family response regulator